MPNPDGAKVHARVFQHVLLGPEGMRRPRSFFFRDSPSTVKTSYSPDQNYLGFLSQKNVK